MKALDRPLSDRTTSALFGGLAVIRLIQGNAAEALALVGCALVFAVLTVADAVRDIGRRPATVVVNARADAHELLTAFRTGHRDGVS